MVGQSPERIGSPLRIFRVPNDLPTYLNAVFEPLAARVGGMKVCISPGGSARPLHFIVDRPSGGSDHLVFSAPPHRLPAAMFGHDDPYWHSDLDTVENVDPTRMKHVMMIAATIALLPARMLDPGEGRCLVNISLRIEEERTESLKRILPDPSGFGGFSIRILREIADRLIASLPEPGARGVEDPSLRPRRLIDGPLLYAVTERFDDEEEAFFKESWSKGSSTCAMEATRQRRSRFSSPSISEGSFRQTTSNGGSSSSRRPATWWGSSHFILERDGL